jgi:hypothetical protein
MKTITRGYGNGPVISRRMLLGFTCAGAVTAGLAPLLSSCAAPAEAAVANPATWDWLWALAEDIAAQVIAKTLEDSFAGIFRHWRSPTAWQVGNQQRYPWYASEIYGVFGPSAVLVRLSHSRHGNPLTDGLLVSTQHGKTAIILPPWAWQGLAMFVASELHGKTGSDLAEGRQVCGLTLIPSKPRVRSRRSPLNTVGYVTYKTTTGWVEISRQSGLSGSTVEVLANGLDSQSGTQTSRTFKLPTTVNELNAQHRPEFKRN